MCSINSTNVQFSNIGQLHGDSNFITENKMKMEYVVKILLSLISLVVIDIKFSKENNDSVI
jgi:hypothetical protein